jgi:hypothetical protein
MKLARMGAVFVLALGVAACPDRDEPADRNETAAADTPTIQQQRAEVGIEHIDMQEIAGSGITGEASIAPDGQNTRVMVRLMGGTPGQKNGHIHSGTCDNLGPVLYELQAVDVAQGGAGTVTSTINSPYEQVTAGSHVIAYHESGGQPGRPVVCGEIPQHVGPGR